MSGDSPYKYKKEKITAGAKRLAEKGDINSYLTKEQEASVTSHEAQIRDRKTEKGFIIDSKGNVAAETIKGSKHSASFAFQVGETFPDSVLIHNHPGQNYDFQIGNKTMSQKIGTTLSGADLETAARRNLKGVRSVTDSYTYNFERPSKGWPNPRDLNTTWTRARAEFQHEHPINSYVERGRTLDEKIGYEARWNTVANHYAMKAVAEKYGIKYTRRRTR